MIDGWPEFPDFGDGLDMKMFVECGPSGDSFCGAYYWPYLNGKPIRLEDKVRCDRGEGHIIGIEFRGELWEDGFQPAFEIALNVPHDDIVWRVAEDLEEA